LLTSNAQAEVDAGPTEAQLRLEGARKLARENPVAVANIVKDWISSEAPA
jgi:flagellar M-ring protein FliF